MVSRIYFAKPLSRQKLDGYKDIYAVASELSPTLIYGIADGKFALIRRDGAVFCPVHETPMMADMMIPEVREEILAIYEDYKDLRRMEVEFTSTK